MKLPLSNRLLACASFVRPGDRVADVGCDHGYLGIHLLTRGIARSVIASDVNEMPLLSAVHNAEKFGVRENMSFYLSNGLQKIPRDFDCVICAGMGADTMIAILEAAPWIRTGNYRLILQCQSKRPELRRYLSDSGYVIRRETLAADGKFIYPVMEVERGEAEPLTDAQCHISPALERSGSDLLPAFRARVLRGLRTTVEGLSHTGGEKYGHYKAILEQLQKES